MLLIGLLCCSLLVLMILEVMIMSIKARGAAWLIYLASTPLNCLWHAVPDLNSPRRPLMGPLPTPALFSGGETCQAVWLGIGDYSPRDSFCGSRQCYNH